MTKYTEPVRRYTLDEHDLADGITYDQFGRMAFHPDFHPNSGKSFSLGELIYIAKFYDIDGPRTISFALGRTEKSIMNMASMLNRSGDKELYRALGDEEWERILEQEEKKNER